MSGSTRLHLVDQNASSTSLDQTLQKSQDLLLSHQFDEGYWWYTLEANESINAEYVFLERYLGLQQPEVVKGLCARMISAQRPDGSWALYHDGPGDLSTTLECYMALKMGGHEMDAPYMASARAFILAHGGVSQCRVFTRIHLAMFGLVPWSICPAMPLSFIAFPDWFPATIYEFSSWARACIVPLLVIMNKKRTHALPQDFVNEVYVEEKPSELNWSYKLAKGWLSLSNGFVQLDRVLRLATRFKIPLAEKILLERCERWIRTHVMKTEDIYPALAYSAMALHALGHDLSDPAIKKCLEALTAFQMPIKKELVSAIPDKNSPSPSAIYQQCCISPVWDTPWAGQALSESGIPVDDAQLLKAGEWLISKQITTVYGDWAIKNKKGVPGGWSFEFENEYFPDVDDTVQVVRFLEPLAIEPERKNRAIRLGVDWVLSMQCKDGGWGAFDVDNTSSWVNEIPFSDHGACLDVPSPDLTGRVLDVLGHLGMNRTQKPIQKGVKFLEKTQEKNGSWWGRWAVDYIFGTSCALQGLKSVGYPFHAAAIDRAVQWLESIQREDGGFGESCASYDHHTYVPLNASVPSQTAWALLGLLTLGDPNRPSVRKAAEFLMKNQNEDGGWDEPHFTGTGFPGHFYIRYHGYRHYFPLLALGRYKKLKSV